MILMHRNMIFLSVALGIMPALQGTMLTRVTSKLPTVTTLKKAMTWKRAGALSALAALVYGAYKKAAPLVRAKYIKTDGQIYLDFCAEAQRSHDNDITRIFKFKERYTLHWFKRYKTHEESYYGRVFENVVRNDGRKLVVAYNIDRGYFFDKHYGHYVLDYQIPEVE